MKKELTLVISAREMCKLLKIKGHNGVSLRVLRGEIPFPDATVLNRGDAWTLDYLRQSRPDLAEQVDKRLAAYRIVGHVRHDGQSRARWWLSRA